MKLLPDRLVIETFAHWKYGFAKRTVEEYFGGLVAFRDERIVDLAKQAAERVEREDREGTGPRLPKDDPDRVPPEVEQELGSRLLRSHYTAFLDKPVPALDGMTPRDAARDPAMRPRLVELMKGHVHHVEQESREKGVDVRIDWVLEELGLDELVE